MVKEEVITQNPNNENLWNSILSEASRNVTDRLESRTLVILGDRNCGKTTLIAKLQGIDISEAGKGIALDYSFLDIYTTTDQDDEPTTRLNVWQLEGEEEHKDLLKFCLNPSTIANSMILIVLDFSQPWNLVISLKRWLKIVEEHVSELIKQLPSGTIEDLKNYQIFDFQSYNESNISSFSGHSTKNIKKKKQVDEQTLLPLAPGVLTHNIGIPIAVVCNKSDVSMQLEKEYSYKESHFDFIHQYIRRICLSYGAGLIYMSAKKDRNCDVLFQYIRHKLYGFELQIKPILEREVMFFPSGYDSFKKISVDFQNQNLTRDPDDLFEDIIKIPRTLVQKNNEIDPIIISEDDQEFLSKHKETLDKIPNSIPSPTTSSTPSIIPSTTPSPILKVPSPSIPTANKSTTEHEILSNFFSSLMKDKPTNLNIPPKVVGTKSQNSTPTIPSRSTQNREDISKQLEMLKGKMNQ